MHELAGKRVVVMGLGRFGGGAGAARFCARQGADVLVTDTAPADRLGESLRALGGENVRYRLGGHDEADFIGADLVVVNPAVDPRDNRYLAAARRARVPLTSEIALLLERVDRRRVIGVTGTAGKSTTTAMIGHILRRTLGDGAVHVGGNLGGSLLDRLERIEAHHRIVLELSSFMLETLDGFSPGVAVVTNLAANHLDRHGSLAAYGEAKKRLLRHQDSEDDAVLGPGVADWANEARGRVHIVGEPGPEVDLLVPGRHNRLNAALALAACRCIGVGGESAAGALADFPGLEHRLRLVAEHGGVRFYDDSKATTPEAALLAIDCFPRRKVHAILGGFDKGADLGELARHAVLRCAGAYTIGNTGRRIAELARRALATHASAPDTAPVGRASAPAGARAGAAPHRASPGPYATDNHLEACDDLVHECGELGAAVAAAVERARPGDVVLLSPGCASWDRYENYEARGRAFSGFALHCAPKAGMMRGIRARVSHRDLGSRSAAGAKEASWAMHISHDYTNFFDIHEANNRLASSVRADFTEGAAGLLGRLSVGEERARRIALDLHDRMSAPGRHYHTPVHVLAMFVYAQRVGVDLSVAEQLAVWFHDAVYDARAPSLRNERQSAQLVRDTLLPLGVARPAVEGAAEGIRWTARHLEDAIPPQHRLLLDLDLAGLSSDTATFTRQSRAVRAEFRHLSDEEYLRGKVGFFQKLLDRPTLYRTDAFAPLESAARAQVRRELNELKGQITGTRVEN